MNPKMRQNYEDVVLGKNLSPRVSLLQVLLIKIWFSFNDKKGKTKGSLQTLPQDGLATLDQ